jgi:glycosyltransferase involved in cell wall biosynthesis
MPTPRVTVVVCTFNRADVLRENIASVMAQGGADFEAVYVDDGSTDATPEVLARAREQHGDRLRVVRTPNCGPGPARNAGVAEARGEWVLFTDDDATAPPGWVATMLERAEARGCDVLAGDIEPFTSAHPAARYEHHRMQIALGPRPRTLRAAPTGNLLIRRALFERVGGFADEPLPAAEDWELSHRLHQAGAAICYDPAAAVIHRYKEDWAAVYRRLRLSGAVGVHIAARRYANTAAYVGYSVARALASPAWCLWRYPLGLYPRAVHLEWVFAAARVRAYLRSLRGLPAHDSLAPRASE